MRGLPRDHGNGLPVSGTARARLLFDERAPEPASAPPPGNYNCPKDVHSGSQTATSIQTLGVSCDEAYRVAKQFIDSPACAPNYQSNSDYSCFLPPYGCSGTIQTTRRSALLCADGTQRQLRFYLDS